VLDFNTELRLNSRPACHWPLWDPLRSIAGTPGTHYAEGERRLLIHLGHLLRQASRPDIEEKLLEYLRIKNAFHEALVHDYGTDGLLRFMENFGRRGFIFGPKARARARRSRRILLDLERYR
jgi:hypothetical protein